MKTFTDALNAVAEAGKLDAAEARDRYLEAMDIVQMLLRNRETEEARQVLHQVVEFFADQLQRIG